MRAVVFRMEMFTVEEEGGMDIDAGGEVDGDWVWEDMVEGLRSIWGCLGGNLG